jgi:lipopolysaccharide export system permease protein
MLNKIWQRYIFKDLLKCFGFFLLAFFLLYMLADFSTHVQDFIKEGKFSVLKIISYYLSQIFKRMPLLLPLALLISTIKVLSSLNLHKELVALQSSGLELKKILAPFWVLACFCTLLGYVNEELVIPRIATYLDEAKLARSKNPLKVSKNKPFTILYLSDSSKLVYQNVDKEKKAFFDVYWIRSYNDIWRMKYLSTDPQKPLGEFVDHIARTNSGFLEKKESYEQCILPSLKWKTSELSKKQTTSKYKKISKLAAFLMKGEGDSFHAKGEATTYLCYKLVMPLMPFLMLLGIVPYCVTYSRNPSIILLYGVSILCFVVFFTLMDSLIIIGENQTVPPYIIMWLPFVLASGIFYRKYRLLFK